MRLPLATNMTSTTPLPDTAMDFDEWDKLMIVFCVSLFLMAVFVMVVCVLSPLCCLYRHCPCQYDKNDDKEAFLKNEKEVYGAMQIQEPRGRKGSSSSVKSKGGSGKWYPMTTLRESEMSDWSDISGNDIIEMKQDPDKRRRRTSSIVSRTSDYSSSNAAPNTILSQPDSRLAYGVMLDHAHSMMHIRVIQLGNFRVLDPDGAQAPYVKVRVYHTPRQFSLFKKSKEMLHNNLDVELQTKIQRRTDNPLLNESFEIKMEAGSVMTSYTIRFVVCDMDKFSRHVTLGEVTCDLSKVDLKDGEEVLYNDLLMVPADENLGELHVALMYLPTAEKLSVTLLSARGLRPLDGPRKNVEIFIKIAMFYEGRQLKKTKSSPRGSELSPSFNETFAFDVPAYQLDKVHFSLALVAVEKDKEDGRHMMGRLYIGVNFEAEARDQWLEMVQHARKQVACWHRLQG